MLYNTEWVRLILAVYMVYVSYSMSNQQKMRKVKVFTFFAALWACPLQSLIHSQILLQGFRCYVGFCEREHLHHRYYLVRDLCRGGTFHIKIGTY